MKYLSIFSLVLFLLVSCGKEESKPTEKELAFPSTFTISHVNTGPAKFYIKKEGNTFLEVEPSNSIQADFDTITNEANAFLLLSNVRKFQFLNTKEVEVYYEYYDFNSGDVIGDTTITKEYTLDKSQLSLSGTSDPHYFFDEAKENLILPELGVYSSLPDFDVISNMDKDFSAQVSNSASDPNIAVNDTFGIRFIDLVFKKK